MKYDFTVYLNCSRENSQLHYNLKKTIQDKIKCSGVFTTGKLLILFSKKLANEGLMMSRIWQKTQIETNCSQMKVNHLWEGKISMFSLMTFLYFIQWSLPLCLTLIPLSETHWQRTKHGNTYSWFWLVISIKIAILMHIL